MAEAEAAAICDQPAVTALVIEGLQRLVRCDGVLLTGFDARAQKVVTTATDTRVPVLRSRDPELWSLCLRHHPTVVEYTRTGTGAPLRFSDLLSLGAYRRLPLYQHFFRPCDVEYKLDVRVWPTSSSVDVGLCRQRHDFDEQDRVMLDALRPYLTVILRRAESTALRDRLRGVFGLTPREGDVLALLVRGHRVSGIAAELVLAEGTVRKHLEHVYDKLGASTRAQAIARILHPSVLSPAATEAVREVLHRLDVQDASSLYALTGREVEVLTLAAAGDTNTQIAGKLGARPQTIKKHLDSIYAKLDVAGRGQAAAHAFGLGLVSVTRDPRTR